MKSRGFFPTIIFLCTFIISSCASVKPPKTIPEQINYSDKDIVENEKQRIAKFLETEPVRALWRASLLKDPETLEKCRSFVEQRFEICIEEKEYLDAKKYYKSLKTVFPDWKSSKYTEAQIEALSITGVPSLSGVNKKAPSKIADCMQATVTIWVDRGVKVENGAGYADVIIGSGFFIDERGYIVTNHHVIESMVDPKYEGYSRLYIKLLNDSVTKIPAKVVGYDSVLDLALLKVEIEPDFVLNLGDSRDLDVGDRISAIGTPVGLEGTLTSGIISSTDRKLISLGNVFQLDAAVNSGNSGGPIIDNNLKVQAIVFAGMLQTQGLNFAIPVEYLKQELVLLFNREEIIHPWISCYGKTKRSGGKKTGLEIQYVLPGGSAIMSGLSIGDVIISLDGKPVTSIDDFNYYMMNYEPETLVNCTYINSDGKEMSCHIYLDKRPKNPGATVYKTDLITGSMSPLFGMRLVSSSTIYKNLYTIDSIIAGSIADEMHFSVNDSVTIRDIAIDEERGAVYVQLYTKRKQKAFLDMGMTLSAPLDSPYYF